MKTALAVMAGLALVAACTSAGPSTASPGPGTASTPAPPSPSAGAPSSSAGPPSPSAGAPSPSAGAPSPSAGAPSLLASITLSPAPRASADALATATRLIGQRAARLGLRYTQAKVSGQNVVMTGPAADEAELKTLAAAGVLRLREVLLQAPPGGTVSGNASLVQPRVLALFDKLTCAPGGSGTAWPSQIGYTTAADWDNPGVQTVSCDSSGNKYALGATEVLGQDVTSAAAMIAPDDHQWLVALTFNRAGTSAFAELTTELHRKYAPGPTPTPTGNDATLDQVAVVLDGSVLSAPETLAPITGGEVQIFGNLTRASAHELAAQLQSGPLPSPSRSPAPAPTPRSQRHDRHHLAADPRLRRCRRPGPLPDRRPGQPGLPGAGRGVSGPAPRPGRRPAGRVPHPGRRQPDARPGRPSGRPGLGERPDPHRLFRARRRFRGSGSPACAAAALGEEGHRL